jgi:hypothetical protein
MVTHQGWTLTPHAEERRIAMHLTRNRVIDAITKAHCTWHTSQHNNNGTTFAHGDVAVIADEADRTVITVLWHTADRYERGHAA